MKNRTQLMMILALAFLAMPQVNCGSTDIEYLEAGLEDDADGSVSVDDSDDSADDSSPASQYDASERQAVIDKLQDCDRDINSHDDCEEFMNSYHPELDFGDDDLRSEDEINRPGGGGGVVLY